MENVPTSHHTCLHHNSRIKLLLFGGGMPDTRSVNVNGKFSSNVFKQSTTLSSLSCCCCLLIYLQNVLYEGLKTLIRLLNPVMQKDKNLLCITLLFYMFSFSSLMKRQKPNICVSVTLSTFCFLTLLENFSPFFSLCLIQKNSNP